MNMTRRLFFITGAERDRTADVKPGTVIYPDRNMKPDTDHKCLPQPVVRIILQTMKMPLNIYSSSDHDNMQKLPYAKATLKAQIFPLHCISVLCYV
ncbi:hypothetical protein EDJ33_23765 [Salmonella enterica]|nr:hypothetical protein [Salmonella enterica subsp. enterica serovar Give]MEH02831.1 hypothetical protein [Salmonella enterica]